MIELAQGSREFLLVKVKDRLNNLDTLDGLPLTFDVRDTDDVLKYQNAPATNDVMTAKCLIDTTGWAVGIYKLWLTIPTGIENVVLGPYNFVVT